MKDKKHRRSQPCAASNSLAQSQREAINCINLLMLQIFLDPKDINEHNVLPFINYLLRKFELSGIIEEIDILIEVYTTAIRKIREDNYHIKKPPSWFKGTALNLIRNISKEMKKEEKVVTYLQAERYDSIRNKKQVTEPVISEDNLKVKAIIEALDCLSDSDKKIIVWRIVDGYSWSDIAEKMVECGDEAVFDNRLIQRLRKRGQRAIHKLRQTYLSMVEGYSSGS